MAVDDGTAVVADGGVGDSGVVLAGQALPYLRGCELGLGEESPDQQPAPAPTRATKTNQPTRNKRERIYQGTIDVASIKIWLRDPVP